MIGLELDPEKRSWPRKHNRAKPNPESLSVENESIGIEAQFRPIGDYPNNEKQRSEVVEGEAETATRS